MSCIYLLILVHRYKYFLTKIYRIYCSDGKELPSPKKILRIGEGYLDVEVQLYLSHNFCIDISNFQIKYIEYLDFIEIFSTVLFPPHKQYLPFSNNR